MSDYVSRAEWGAKAGDPAPSPQFRGPLERIWVHTGAVRLDEVGDVDEEYRHIRSYERWAVDVRGFTAIGYNGVVGQSGTRFVGRGFDRRSGANYGRSNDNAMSVCVIGHGDYEPLGNAAQAALSAVINDMIAQHGATRVRILGHREEPAPKSCPGDLIMPWVRANRDGRGYWTGGSQTPAPPTPPTPSGTFKLSFSGGSPMTLRFVKDGVRGEDVRHWQNALNDGGYRAGAVDGVAGPKTAAAIGRAQRRYGLKQDQILGPVTAEPLIERG